MRHKNRSIVWRSRLLGLTCDAGGSRRSAEKAPDGFCAQRLKEKVSGTRRRSGQKKSAELFAIRRRACSARSGDIGEDAQNIGENGENASFIPGERLFRESRKARRESRKIDLDTENGMRQEG